LIGIKAGDRHQRHSAFDTNQLEGRMSHTPHELSEEFPQHIDRMSELKSSDAHFAKLFEEYHDLNRAVHRAETNVEPMDSLAETDLRKRRAHLKDEIWGYLSE
jgi:uncharacterized protein